MPDRIGAFLHKRGRGCGLPFSGRRWAGWPRAVAPPRGLRWAAGAGLVAASPFQILNTFSKLVSKLNL
jgi:hypothetical protein